MREARATALQRRLTRSGRSRARRRALIRAELKAEAVRAGMVDLDGLKLVDPGGLSSTRRRGAGRGGADDALKRAKPWLFGGTSASSPAAAAAGAAAARAKLATEMTDDE